MQDDKSTRTRKQTTKNPCGKCAQECVSGNGSSLPCGGACGFHYHTACVEGMTPEFAENCGTMTKIHGISPFFCLICRRFIDFSNTTFTQQADLIKAVKDEGKETKTQFKDEMKDVKIQLRTVTMENKVLIEKVAKLETNSDQAMNERMERIEGRINDAEQRANAAEARANTAELELQQVKAELERMKNGTDQVKEQIVVMEKEIETGMEQAKKEFKEELTVEMRTREEKACNIVIYGAKESEKESAAERVVEDERFVRDLAEAIEVEIVGEVEPKYRAGKKQDGGKPRPLVVKVSDEETREKLLQKARFLGRDEDWKSVFVSLDLTNKERDEAKKKEEKMREEAKKRTEEEAKNGTRTGGRYVVAGMRGRERWLAWRAETRRAV